MKKCTSCGFEFEGNFCPNCGAKYEPPAQPAERFCSNCGAKLGTGDFCSNCGTRYGSKPETPAEDVPAVTATEDVPAPAAEDMPAAPAAEDISAAPVKEKDRFGSFLKGLIAVLSVLLIAAVVVLNWDKIGGLFHGPVTPDPIVDPQPDPVIDPDPVVDPDPGPAPVNRSVSEDEAREFFDSLLPEDYDKYGMSSLFSPFLLTPYSLRNGVKNHSDYTYHYIFLWTGYTEGIMDKLGRDLPCQPFYSYGKDFKKVSELVSAGVISESEKKKAGEYDSFVSLDCLQVMFDYIYGKDEVRVSDIKFKDEFITSGNYIGCLGFGPEADELRFDIKDIESTADGAVITLTCTDKYTDWYEDGTPTTLYDGVTGQTSKKGGQVRYKLYLTKDDDGNVIFAVPDDLYISRGNPNLRVRKGPGTTYDTIGHLKTGIAIRVMEEKDGWGRVEYEGQEGWISLQYADKAV